MRVVSVGEISNGRDIPRGVAVHVNTASALLNSDLNRWLRAGGQAGDAGAPVRVPASRQFAQHSCALAERTRNDPWTQPSQRDDPS